jgi:branched-chain amino acid transport system ATP-binding protein
MILEVEDIHTFYGMSQILFGVSLEVNEREAVSLLGRNGVGKTTALRSIMGLTPPRKGKVKLRGEDITGQHPFAVAWRGIGYVPEERRIFSDLTVMENLTVAQKKHTSSSVEWTVERVFELFPVLKGRLS